MIQFTTARDFLDICEMGDRTAIPYHVSAPAEVWQELIDDHIELRRTIAMNKTIPNQIIQFLALDRDADIRCEIANKRKTPSDILLKLGHDCDEFVRRRVAYNPKVTIEILESMRDDDSDMVREVVEEKLHKLRKSQSDGE